MKPVNIFLRPFRDLVQGFLNQYNMKVVRLVHGSIVFINEGKHWDIKCPLENKDLKVAEIGVYRGINSEEIMKYLNVSKLYLIDPYKSYENTFMGNQDWEKAEKEAWERMRKWIGNEVSFIRLSSDDAVSYIPDKMDYVYIDGDHNYNYVKRDIENYYRKVRKGGILAGHDIGIPDVLKAVFEFSTKNKIKFFIIKDDWVIIK